MAEVTQALSPSPPQAQLAPSPKPATGSGNAANSPGAAKPVTLDLANPRQSMPPVTLQAKTPVPSTSPASTAPAAVPLKTLLYGADFSEKLKVLDTNPDWVQLPPELHRKIIEYVSRHPDKIAPISAKLRQFGDIEREQWHLIKGLEPDAHFAEWLQAQPEELKDVYAKFYQPIMGGPHRQTPEQRVDQWLARHQPVTADLVLAKLRASPSGVRQYLVDQALLFMGDRVFVEVGEIAKGVRGDEALRGIVAAALLKHAVALQAQSLGEGDKAHKLAFCCAANLTVAMAGASDELGLLLSQMSKAEGELFAKALDGEQPRVESASLFDRFLAALNSAPRTAATGAIVHNLYLQTVPDDLTKAPGLAHDMAVAKAREWHPDDKAKAVVEVARLEALMQGRGAKLLFDGIPARKAFVLSAVRSESRITADLLAHDNGDPARNRIVANAIAHVMIATVRMMPFGAAEEDAAMRLGGILSIAAGQQLFFSDKVPAAARGQALAVIIAHPEITSATFKTGSNPWLAPELAKPIAELYTQGYGDDTSQPLPGLSLDNMVGTAMGIAPTFPEGQEWRDFLKGVDGQAVAAKIAAGEPVTAKDLGDAYDLLTGISFYSHQKNVAGIAEKIKHCANTDPPRVKLLPVIVFGENGPIKCPLFRVQSGINGEGDATYAYIDNAGRKYDSIEHWAETNRLPVGRVYYPAGGHLSRPVDVEGGMILVSADTPRTHQKWLEALDTAAVAGLLAAGAVGMVVTVGALAFVAAGVGAASGGWMTFRSGSDQIDRLTHGQSVSPLDPEALGNYLGVIGGVAGGVAFIGTAARGARLGQTATSIIGGAYDVAAVTGVAGLVQQGGMLIKNRNDLPPEVLWREVLKALMFGGITLAGAAKQRPAPASVPPIGSPPRAPSNPTIGKLPPAVATIRPGKPSSPGTGYDPAASGKPAANSNASPGGNGYDPVASGKPAANGNVSPDAIRMTADGGLPHNGPNRTSAMADNKGPPKQPPWESTQPSTRSSGTPTTAEAAPSRPARGDVKPDTGGLSREVQAAKDKVLAAQTAFDAALAAAPKEGNPKVFELAKQLDGAVKQYEAAVARQPNQPPAHSPGRNNATKLTRLTAARKEAEKAYEKVRNDNKAKREQLEDARDALTRAEAAEDAESKPRSALAPGLSGADEFPPVVRPGATRPPAGSTPTAGQAPTPRAILARNVTEALHDFYRTEALNGVIAADGPLNFKDAAGQYRQVLQEARAALRAHNAAGEKNLKKLTRLNQQDPVNPRVPLQLIDLEKVFPELAQMVHNLHEPSLSGPRSSPEYSQGHFDSSVDSASRAWDAFAQEAAKGKGLTPELVGAMTKANQSLVWLEKHLNDAPSGEVRKAWQDRIEQARQIFDGYIAEVYIENWLTAPALHDGNRAAAPEHYQGRGGDAHTWSNNLRHEFKVSDTRLLTAAPRTPEDPLMSYKLAGLAEAANKANHNLTDALSAGNNVERFWDAVADLSHELRDLDTALNGLDPKSLSVPPSWNSKMQAWRSRLENGVRELNNQAAFLDSLIKIKEVTETLAPQGAGTSGEADLKTLKSRLSYIQSVLRLVEQDVVMASAEVN